MKQKLIKIIAAMKTVFPESINNISTATFNNFAARMDWANDGKGNRNPVVVVNGDNSLATMKITSAHGNTVILDASATTDPDGDKLTFNGGS